MDSRFSRRIPLVANAPGPEDAMPAPGLPAVGAEGLLEATPECVVLTAGDRRIIFANHRLEELSGYSRGELVGEPIERLLPGGIAEPDGREAATYGADCRRKDGDRVPVQVNLGVVQA